MNTSEMEGVIAEFKCPGKIQLPMDTHLSTSFACTLSPKMP
jgi:hypothetical protein